MLQRTLAIIRILLLTSVCNWKDLNKVAFKYQDSEPYIRTGKTMDSSKVGNGIPEGAGD